MSTDVEVVRADTADVETLSGLQWQWRVDEWSADPVVDRDGFAARMSDWFAQRADAHWPFLARVDGTTVGMAWLAAIERVPTPAQLRRRHGQVQSVYVIPAFRDRGVGSLLLRRLIDEARTREFDYLIVHPSVRSFPFYRRHGFSGSGDFLELRLDSAESRSG